MAQTKLSYFNMGDAERIADPWEEEQDRRRRIEIEQQRLQEAMRAAQAQESLGRSRLAAEQQQSKAKMGLDAARLSVEQQDMFRRQGNEERRLSQADLAREQRERMADTSHDRALGLLDMQRGQQLDDRGAKWEREDALRTQDFGREDQRLEADRALRMLERGEDRGFKVEDRDFAAQQMRELETMRQNATSERERNRIEEQIRAAKVREDQAKVRDTETARSNKSREGTQAKRVRLEEERLNREFGKRDGEQGRQKTQESQAILNSIYQDWSNPAELPTDEEVLKIERKLSLLTPEQRKVAVDQLKSRIDTMRKDWAANPAGLDTPEARELKEQGFGRRGTWDSLVDTGFGFQMIPDRMFQLGWTDATRSLNAEEMLKNMDRWGQ